MGVFSSLFGGREPGASASPGELLDHGKKLLFSGDSGGALKWLDRAASADRSDPLPLAYRCLARRTTNKEAALKDATAAIELDDSCSEAYMSRALAYVTGTPQFEEALLDFGDGKDLAPRDVDGAVLLLGIYLVFFDAIVSATEDEYGVHFDFKSTDLRNGADWLLSGQYPDAFLAFNRVFQSGREIPAALGLVATGYRMNDMELARDFSVLLLDSDALSDAGVMAAVERIYQAASA